MSQDDIAARSLRDRGLANTPLLSAAGFEGLSRLVDVSDGDTVTVIVELFPDRFFKLPIRLHGIDACEMHATCAEARRLAFRARSRVLELLSGATLPDSSTKREVRDFLASRTVLVWVSCGANDKYGRTLGHVRASRDAPNVAEVLLAERLAVPYAGGRRMEELDQIAALSV